MPCCVGETAQVIEVFDGLLPVTGDVKRVGDLGLIESSLHQEDIVGVIFDK